MIRGRVNFAVLQLSTVSFTFVLVSANLIVLLESIYNGNGNGMFCHKQESHFSHKNFISHIFSRYTANRTSQETNNYLHSRVIIVAHVVQLPHSISSTPLTLLCLILIF